MQRFLFHRLAPSAGALLLSGCVGAGFKAPDYVDLDALMQPVQEQDAERAAELLRAPELGLPGLLAAAELQNPRIAAARHAVGAAAGRAWQAELYPNPQVRLQAEEAPADNPGLHRSINTASVIQPIVLGQRREAALAAARAEGDARALTLEQTRREVAAQLREVRVELLYLERAQALTGELVEAAERTLEVAETRLAARAVPESEVLKAQVETQSLRLGQRRLERERAAALARLRALLGVQDLAGLSLGGALNAELPIQDLGELLGKLSEHPGLLAAQAGAVTASREADLARAQRIPDLSVQFGYGRDNAADQQILRGGISIPLPLFDRNQGRIHEAEEREQQRVRTAEALERSLQADLARLVADYTTARDVAETHRAQIVPAAERAFAQVGEGYRAGRGSFLDLLDAQRTLTRARLSGLGALRDAHRALARLSQLTGPLGTE